MPTQEMGDHMRECFGKMGPPPGEKPGEGPGGWPASSGTPMMGPEGQQPGVFNIDSLPSQVKECVILNFGANFSERVKSGEIKGQEFGEQIRKCFGNFQPQQGESNTPMDTPGNVSSGQMMRPMSPEGAPPQNFVMPQISSGSQPMMPSPYGASQTQPAAPLLQMDQQMLNQPLLNQQQVLPPPPSETSSQPVPSGFVPTKMLLGLLIEAFDNIFQKLGF